MLILSRHRNPTESETQLAETLANRLETLVLSIPFLYDLPCSGQTVENLRTITEPVVVLAPLPPRPLKILARQILQRQEQPLAAYDSRSDNAENLCEFIRELQQAGLPVGNVPGGKVEHGEEPAVPRWYPIIDTQRCIGCLECVNFCLFGVYAVGENDKPFVDQPDACRDGCPACSRVCPGKAIIFPLYDDPVISGAAESVPEENADELDNLVDIVDRLL